MKKFSVIMAFVLTVFAVQFAVVSEVEARDVYVGTSDTTGDVQFLYYDFWVGNYGYFHFQNSRGFSGIADRQCPIEFRMVLVAAP